MKCVNALKGATFISTDYEEKRKEKAEIVSMP